MKTIDFKIGDVVVDLVGGDHPKAKLATVIEKDCDDGGSFFSAYRIEHFIDGKAPPSDSHGPNGIVRADEIRMATQDDLAHAMQRSYVNLDYSD